jgi:predicted RNase H-like nuclease (RuvC/YqgF family)
MKVIDDSPGVLPDQAMNGIWATEEVELEIIDAYLSERVEPAEQFGRICDMNESLSAKGKDLEATEPVRDGPSRELAASQQDIETFEDKLQIEKCRFDMLGRRLNKCKSELEPTEQTDIAQLRLEKDMLLHQVKNLSSETGSQGSDL